MGASSKSSSTVDPFVLMLMEMQRTDNTRQDVEVARRDAESGRQAGKQITATTA